ncbi:MAG: thiamine pyrophosphate-dependent enzyme, partial [Chloroflexi bacterium]|nr:thiamine pyrophosphate-dependent enzyme [Chloroflexota bacterium]
ANAIVGGSLAIAAGAALSAKRRHTDQVTVCFFGDGAANQGLFFESMNLASIWRLPVIYVCENNHYGEFTAMKDVTAGRLEQRSDALDIPSTQVDGMDVLKVHEASAAAVARARAGEGPRSWTCDTYRYFGHGMSDRDRSYRTREEEQAWRKNDPIDRLGRYLIAKGQTTQADLESIAARVDQEMLEAIDVAKASPLPGPEELRRHVFAD